MIYSVETIKDALRDQGITEVYFDGAYHSVEDTNPTALLYILIYGQVTGSGAIVTPKTRDYLYRMSQALQMFGDPVVVASIQDLIDNDYSQ